MHCCSLALSIRSNCPMQPILPLAAAVDPIELAGIANRHALAVSVAADADAVAVMAVVAIHDVDSRQRVP